MAGKIRVSLPQFAATATYRIGGLLFEDGVAEVDELSHSDREVIEMLGAEVEGDDEAPAAPAPETGDAAPEGDQAPAGDEQAPTTPEETPSAPETAPPAAPEPETAPEQQDAPEAPEETPEPETAPEAPAEGSSFVDPTPATDEAAAAPGIIQTVDSSTDGTETLDAPQPKE